ncbi:SIS domain-containing protein [Lachnospiraceae bacterium ASD3451]|uniref:D-sedoheptulose-7-phosphate isomerase n=1 Tax=Diplocloster agilis TaxID=2850323 RepID=UPI001DC05C1F|nr:SIS domain-containing protein [Diplocloster agilis]MBU9743099.1 SIS domain-containing protein [Diplocloster agilis]
MEKSKSYLDELIVRYPVLDSIKEDIMKAYEVLEECYENGNKLLIAGNGGSASDAEHIVGELMKSFIKPRHMEEEFISKLISCDEQYGKELGVKLQGGLPAIALSVHNSLNTAFLNDVDGLLCFAQEVCGYGKEGDVLLGISTSGNAENIIYAAVTARAKGMKVIGLTGKDGGRLRERADTCIIAPEFETYKIQELHLPIYHTLCLMLEERFFQ